MDWKNPEEIFAVIERAWGLAKLEFKKLAFITKYLIKCAMV